MKNRYRLWSILLVLPLVLVACGGPSQLRFLNDTECGTIAIRITDQRTNLTTEYEVAVGEELVVEVTPNVSYTYEADYTYAGENEAGFVCTDVRRGQITVPVGASTNFTLIAVTPTPGPDTAAE